MVIDAIPCNSRFQLCIISVYISVIAVVREKGAVFVVLDENVALRRDVVRVRRNGKISRGVFSDRYNCDLRTLLRYFGTQLTQLSYVICLRQTLVRLQWLEFGEWRGGLPEAARLARCSFDIGNVRSGVVTINGRLEMVMPRAG